MNNHEKVQKNLPSLETTLLTLPLSRPVPGTTMRFGGPLRALAP